MKKVLFAINQDSDKTIENQILNCFKEDTGKEFIFRSEYYLDGVEKALLEEEYDVLILREDLENTNEVTLEFLDKITDRYPELNITFIISDEHVKDEYVKTIFNIGIYNVLYKRDFTITNIVDLIENNRTKADAKSYLNFSDIQEIYSKEELEEISDEILEQTLFSLKNCTIDNISYVFDEINSQFTLGQMLFLVSMLPEDIQKLLQEADNNLYKRYKERLGNRIRIEVQKEFEVIEKEKVKVVEKKVIKEVVKEVVKPVYIEKTVKKTIKQQIITFYTTDNDMDKDDALTQLSILLAKKSTQKILVIDMNPIFPKLDHYFNVDKEIAVRDIYTSQMDTGMIAVYNAIEKNIFSADLLEQFTNKHKKYPNLHILTGIYDLSKFDEIGAEHYDALINSAVEIYDTIIINTNPDIALAATYTALKKATTIMMVCNCNYTYARDINSILSYMIEYHKIPKSKFKILLNNVSKYSLDKDMMKKIFEEFEVMGYIPSNNYREQSLNERKAFITSAYAKKDIVNYLDIIETLGYVPKTSKFDKLFKRKKIATSIIEIGEGANE